MLANFYDSCVQFCSLHCWVFEVVRTVQSFFQGHKLKAIILLVGGDLEMWQHLTWAPWRQTKMWCSLSMLQQKGFSYSPKFPHDETKKLILHNLVCVYVVNLVKTMFVCILSSEKRRTMMMHIALPILPMITCMATWRYVKFSSFIYYFHAWKNRMS